MGDTLIGMIGRRRVRKRGASPRSQSPADFDVRVVQVLGAVGPSHFLIQAIGQPHAVISDVSGLMRYSWFQTVEDSRRADATDPEDEDE